MYKIGEKIELKFKPEEALVQQSIKNVQRYYAGHNHAFKEMGTCTYILKIKSTGEVIEVSGNYLDLDNVAMPGLVTFVVNEKKQFQWGETIMVKMVLTPHGIEYQLHKEDADETWDHTRHAMDDDWAFNDVNYIENYDEGDDPRFFDDHEFQEVHYTNGKVVNYPLDDESHEEYDDEEYDDEEYDDEEYDDEEYDDEEYEE